MTHSVVYDVISMLVLIWMPCNWSCQNLLTTTMKWLLVSYCNMLSGLLTVFIIKDYLPLSCKSSVLVLMCSVVFWLK